MGKINHTNKEIVGAVEGRHDMATAANVAKLIRLNKLGQVPNKVVDAVEANFEEKNNCVGEQDWQSVIDAPDSKKITIAESQNIARKVHASVNHSSDPRNIDWNDRIDALLADLGLGWKLRDGTYIDGLDCQFIGALSKTIRANAVEKY